MDDSPPALPPPPLHSTRGLTSAMTGLLALYLAIQVAHIGILALLRARVGEAEELPAWLVSLDQLQTKLPFLTIGLYFGCGVCFLFLVARLVRNLPKLGSVSTLQPRDAVVGFFIPFANLVHGYRTVDTIWRESQPERPPGYAPLAVPLIGWWWGAYLLLAVGAHGIAKAAALPPVYSLEAWVTASYWISFQCALDLVAGALFLLVVRALDARQRAQHDDLVRRVPVPPSADRLR